MQPHKETTKDPTGAVVIDCTLLDCDVYLLLGDRVARVGPCNVCSISREVTRPRREGGGVVVAMQALSSSLFCVQ